MSPLFSMPVPVSRSRSRSILLAFVVVATAPASSVGRDPTSAALALAPPSPHPHPLHLNLIGGGARAWLALPAFSGVGGGAFLTQRYRCGARLGFASPAPSSSSSSSSSSRPTGAGACRRRGARTPWKPPHVAAAAAAAATTCHSRRNRNPFPWRTARPAGAGTPIAMPSSPLGMSPLDIDHTTGGDDGGEAAGAITDYDDVLVSDTPPSERGIGVGVDLGTTNSAVAVPTGGGGRPTIVPVPVDNLNLTDGGDSSPSPLPPPLGRTVPSVVCFAGRGGDEGGDYNEEEEGTGAATSTTRAASPSPFEEMDVLVGEEAVRREHVYPRSTFRNVKRIIGTGGRMAARNAPLVPNFAALHGEGEGEGPPPSKRNSKSKRRKNKKGRKRHVKGGDDEVATSDVTLSQQLRDARERPAMLSLSIPRPVAGRGGGGPGGTEAGVGEGGNEADELLVAPEEVCSHVLRRLFRAAEAHTNETVTRAVVGVPAYFNDAQRDATERACRLAGVGKVRLIREPEAAALAYGLGRERQKRGGINDGSGSSKGEGEFDDDDELVLVFDLGGGTFDVSVLRVGGGLMEVVASGGNAMLGGSDFDHSIAQHIQKQIVASAKGGGGTNLSPKEVFRNPAVRDALLRSAEAVRVYLSNHRRATLAVPSTEEGWLSMARASDVLIPRNDVAGLREAMKLSITAEAEAYLILENDERPMCNETHVVFDLSRAEMEELCRDQLQALLRPVREVAILAGALLPGDARPSLVEAAFAMEDEHPSSALASGEFEEFYAEAEDGGRLETMVDGVAPDEPRVTDGDEAAFDADALLQVRTMDVKAMRKEQQRGRERARNLATRERKFLHETRMADQKAKGTSGVDRGGGSGGSSSSVGGKTVKVQDSIGGRPLSQVVLVGGATRMPAIGRLLSALTGVVPRKTVNPDEAVALGAAIQVGILDGDEVLGEMQVLSPIQAAVLRAVARKRGLDVNVVE